MARRKSTRGSKIQPSVLTMAFQTPLNISGTNSYTVDLSQAASLLNRRFYRQGINWAVAGFKIFSKDDAIGTIQITKLPNTWVMSNAWEKGFRAWQKMNLEAMAEAPSARPKFLDFKVFADAFHAQQGSAANLLPTDSASVEYVPGEWDYSTYEIPLSDASPANSVTRDVIAIGANYSGPGASGNFAVSLIEGYAASRALPNILEPNMPADAIDASGSVAENWQSALFNEGTTQDSEVLLDLQAQNNQAPYPFENDGIHADTMYPGGANQAPNLQLHDRAYVTSTTVGSTNHLKGGNFPCGLVRFEFSNSVQTTYYIQIDLIPGNHRGYLCEPMTEM